MNQIDEINERYKKNMLEEEKSQLLSNAENITRFKNLCAEKGIQLSDANFSYIQTIGIVASYPNLLSILKTEIKEDKEELVSYNILNNHFKKGGFNGGYLYDPNYIIMAHPYFRRWFYTNNNFAPMFLDLFWRLQKPELDLSIAMDFDRVRINVDNSAIMELDTWYGANFTKEINQIPDGVSKLRPPRDIEDRHISFFFSNAYSLDTLWETKNGIKTFQAEEFKTQEVKIIIGGKEFYPVRYIHAEFDLDQGFFRHFDGAIHLYTESEYYQRRDSDLNFNSKNSHQIKANSRKLFKMNGAVDINTWVEFSSHFFTGNPLIIEYFEGKYPDYIIDFLEKVRAMRQDD